MKNYDEFHDAIITIREFIDGTGGVWDWDDFISCPAGDPRVLKARNLCRGLPTRFPPTDKAHYCGEIGMVELRSILAELEGMSEAQL